MKAPIRTVATTAGAVFGLALALGTAQAQDATEPVAKQPTAAPTRESAVATPIRESGTTAPASTMAPEAQPAPKAKAPGRSELKGSIARLTKFEDFDKNKDGSLAQAEIPANDELSLKFSSYDKDSDAKISQAEFATYKNGDRQLARNKPKADQSKPEQQ